VITDSDAAAVAAAVGMVRFAHVFLEVEVATETTRADRTRERLHLAVSVHVKRQVVHLQFCKHIDQLTN